MAQGLSSTCLPAAKVCDAARLALAAAIAEQAGVKAMLIAQYRVNRGWRARFSSDEQIWENLSPEIRKIVELHRASDIRVLTALGGLAQAAFRYSEEFSVEVTADDFRLLLAFYERT